MAQSISTLLKPTFSQSSLYQPLGMKIQTTTPALPKSLQLNQPTPQLGVVTVPKAPAITSAPSTVQNNPTSGLVAPMSQAAPQFLPQQPPVAPTAPKMVSTPGGNDTSRGLFGSVLGSIAKPQQTPEQQEYLRRLAESSAAGIGVGERAADTARRYGQEISRVGQLGAGAQAGAMSTGTDVVGRGNAAIASQSASQRMQALAQGLGAELQGTEQQLTATGQQISGLGTAAQQANAVQQMQLQSQQVAAGLAQPTVAAFGQTVFDPTTGTYVSSGGNLDPQTQATQLAQAVMSGRMTYEQALSSMGYAGQAGTTFLNNAITGAGGNALQLQASGAAQQANIGTQNTSQANIAQQGLQQSTQTYVQMNTAAQFAGEQSMAVTDILQRAGLNNASSSDYNKALSKIQTRLSDVDRVALNTALQEARIAYTNLLSSTGGTPTGNESSALATLDPNQSAAAINASIKELEAGGGQTTPTSGSNFDW